MILDSQLYTLLILTIFAIIVIVIGYVIVKIKTARLTVQLAEHEINKKKLEINMKRMLIEDLKNASIMLSDREKGRLDSIKADNSVLSRKNLFLMNEMEDRTRRLELGSTIAKMNQNLGKINAYENDLFGHDPSERHRKRVKG